jgi:hypothetical protein
MHSDPVVGKTVAFGMVRRCTERVEGRWWATLDSNQ